ncbi:unnamed protein product [Meloidogyne enterolobii]|uniref:Uncharacterized protein n=1 Tax=Meloidogyne enterolobii TaxID=390850 RepID=A0ACB0YE65_MELEN
MHHLYNLQTYLELNSVEYSCFGMAVLDTNARLHDVTNAGGPYANQVACDFRGGGGMDGPGEFVVRRRSATSAATVSYTGKAAQQGQMRYQGPPKTVQ